MLKSDLLRRCPNARLGLSITDSVRRRDLLFFVPLVSVYRADTSHFEKLSFCLGDVRKKMQ